MAVNKKTEAEVDTTSNDVMSKIDEMIAAKMAEAEKRADEIVKAAENKATEIQKKINGTDVDEEMVKTNAELEEYVEVKLFKDNDRYKDDVFVCVNGENCVIQRGVKVKIKKKFANVLEQSDMQDFHTAQLIDSKENEYMNSAREHGLN